MRTTNFYETFKILILNCRGREMKCENNNIWNNTKVDQIKKFAL